MLQMMSEGNMGDTAITLLLVPETGGIVLLGCCYRTREWQGVLT